MNKNELYPAASPIKGVVSSLLDATLFKGVCLDVIMDLDAHYEFKVPLCGFCEYVVSGDMASAYNNAHKLIQPYFDQHVKFIETFMEKVEDLKNSNV